MDTHHVRFLFILVFPPSIIVFFTQITFAVQSLVSSELVCFALCPHMRLAAFAIALHTELFGFNMATDKILERGVPR
jgi:hypothetical protein